MPRKKKQSRLSAIAEVINTADLRLRLAESLGDEQRNAAIQELTSARLSLMAVVTDIRLGKYHGEVE